MKEHIPRLASGKVNLKEMAQQGNLFYDLDEVKNATPPELLWGNWLARKRIHLQVGASTVKKTTFNFSLQIALQRQEPFLGVKGTPCKVLYFDAEADKSGLRGRCNLIGLDWAKDTFNNFKIVDCSIIGANFFDIVKYIQSDLVDKSWQPDIIYLDSISTLFTVADKDNIEAANVVGKIRDLSQRWNCAFVLVHHPSKAQEHGVYSGRGASNWGNLADCIWNFYELGKGFSTDIFVLEILKSRFADDQFFQCIKAEAGQFIPIEVPIGYAPDHPQIDKGGGIVNYQRQEAIKSIMKDGVLYTTKEIMKLADIEHDLQFQRAMRPLLQIGWAEQQGRGVYRHTNNLLLTQKPCK
jgi:hypothetical protein